jgi:Flp pilus assembly protein TadD
VDEFRQALRLSPDDAEVHGNLGVVLLKLNRHEEAVAVYSAAVRLQPDSAQAWCNLGVALRSTGQPRLAIDAYNRAIALLPESAEAHMNLGVALDAAGERENAIAAYRRAIAIDPNLANAHYNLANALADNDDPQAAVDAYRQAILLRENFVAAHSNLGKTLMRLGQIDAAMESYNRAIELDPQSAHPHWNRALALLLQGKLQQGWAEYEWRNRQAAAGSQLTHELQWNGEPLNGRTIFLHAEEGLGDAVQMVRYVPLVSARGGRVVLQCHRELIELFTALPGVDRLIAHGEPIPDWDLHCPLMGLPRAFGTALDSIPANVPYLGADPARVEQWQARPAPFAGRRIGLVWAGAPEHQYDRHRSVGLSVLAPIFDVPGVQYVSLQKGAAAEQTKALPPGCELIDHAEQLIDYADTAALISQLDLVIAVDTSVAHVAAAMGKPVWMLLAYAPDWRWLLDRSDSPWYPTMRLFRQQTRGDWKPVVQMLADELRATGLKG